MELCMFMCQSIRASGYGFPLVEGKINAKLPTSEVHILFIWAKFKWGPQQWTSSGQKTPTLVPLLSFLKYSPIA